jgi:[acyl-carrier-protein] S-malonyltransferase
MGKIAFVFPGQGAQAVGMGKDAYEQASESRAVFERADQVLGFELSKLIFDGPEEQLKQTFNTQPALLATSIALYEAFKHQGVAADYVAGHSLGEYSALVVAGVMTLDDALATVRTRGLLMERSVPNGQGAMAAALGADQEALEALCRDVSAKVGVVELANLNCPGQIVVSGSKAGVAAIVERGKEAGAKRVIPLDVSGPFHSSLMKPAAEQLGEALAKVPLTEARVQVVANVTARPITSPEQIRQLLIEQVYSPVRWEESVTWLIGQGVDRFVEIGSGTVLAGLIKKIDRSVSVISLNSLESIRNYSA